METTDILKIAKEISSDAAEVQTLLNQVRVLAKRHNDPTFRIEMLEDGIVRVNNIIRQCGKLEMMAK